MNNSSTHMLRLNRAEYLMACLNDLDLMPGYISKGISAFRDAYLKEFNGEVKMEWHGLLSTGQTYVCFEFGEVVAMVSRGFRVGYDEAVEIYASQGCVIGTDLVKVPTGVFIQNEDQLLDDQWWSKMVTVLRALPVSDKTNAMFIRLSH